MSDDAPTPLIRSAELGERYGSLMRELHESGAPHASACIAGIKDLLRIVDRARNTLREVQWEQSSALIELSPSLERAIIELIGPHPRDVGPGEAEATGDLAAAARAALERVDAELARIERGDGQ